MLLAFCHGTNLGPSQVARHMRGTVTARELTIAATHAPADKIHAASADVINAYSELDLPALWGDGASAGVDGTQVDTWENNVLAETSIRYGGYGGIAYRHISDTYIALFSHFIPCGVWEAVYLIEGLLRNDSAVQPEVIHGDTQRNSGSGRRVRGIRSPGGCIVAEIEQGQAGRLQRWREKRRLKREARANRPPPLLDPKLREAEDARRRSGRDHKDSSLDQSAGGFGGGDA